MFHVLVLKKCKPQLVIPLSLLDVDTIVSKQPMTLISRHELLLNGQRKKQVVIQWEGESTKMATWKDEDIFRGQYSDWNLEVKVPLVADGYVMIPELMEDDRLSNMAEAK